MQELDLKSIVQSYLQSLENVNLEQCLNYFTDDASIKFMSGVFEGKEAIKEWHQDRFAAGMKVTHINSITVKGNVVFVDGTVTSDRLKSWKIGSLRGKATFIFNNEKINETHYGLRVYNPSEGW